MIIYRNMFLGELREGFTVVGEVPEIINSFPSYEESYISSAYMSGKKLYGDLHMTEPKQQHKFIQVLCVPSSDRTLSIRWFSFKKEEKSRVAPFSFSRGKIFRNRLEI